MHEAYKIRKKNHVFTNRRLSVICWVTALFVTMLHLWSTQWEINSQSIQLYMLSWIGIVTYPRLFGSQYMSRTLYSLQDFLLLIKLLVLGVGYFVAVFHQLMTTHCSAWRPLRFLVCELLKKKREVRVRVRERIIVSYQCTS